MDVRDEGISTAGKKPEADYLSSQRAAGLRRYSEVNPIRRIRCLVPELTGNIYSNLKEQKPWDKYYTEQPRPR
ncbi:MAG: hypothetical protein WC685_08060, partial [Methylobacter sp.]